MRDGKTFSFHAAKERNSKRQWMNQWEIEKKFILIYDREREFECEAISNYNIYDVIYYLPFMCSDVKERKLIMNSEALEMNIINI